VESIEGDSFFEVEEGTEQARGTGEVETRLGGVEGAGEVNRRQEGAVRPRLDGGSSSFAQERGQG
jgi:hypothetical protein